jgi:ribosome-associated protein
MHPPSDRESDQEFDSESRTNKTIKGDKPVQSMTSPPAKAPADPISASARAIRPHGVQHGRRLAAAAAQVAVDNKGQDVAVIDVCAQSAEFDFFVLATGSSRRQLHAISEQIDDVLEKELGDRRLGIEGYQESRWIVLDYGSVVIHLFDEETREYYDLESLWADGTNIPLSELGINHHEA